ncbi:MAG: precorrin-8X methylmutase [Kiritimatiellia bacterium]|jgi:precorrin isomerase
MTKARIHAFLANPRSGPEIERRSFAIIDAEIGAHGFAPDQWEIVRRMLHTAGDLGLAQAIRFTPDAVMRGVGALRAGAYKFIGGRRPDLLALFIKEGAR